MAFYIRKSFKAGPVRLNLSKSGLGASIGGKGARIGVSARGQAYVSGGLGGISYRQNLSGGRRSSSRRVAGSGSTVVIQEDTGVTFAPEGIGAPTRAPDLSLPPKPTHRVAAAIFGYPLALVGSILAIAVILGDASDEGVMQGLAVALVLGGLAWPAIVARQAVRAWRARDLANRLAEMLGAVFSQRELADLVEGHSAAAADIAHATHAGYLDLLGHVLADERVEDSEIERLSAAEAAFSLAPAFVSRSRVSAFRRLYLGAVSDHELSEEEEATLEHVRTRLGVQDAEIEADLDTIEQLKELRAVRSGRLPAIETRLKLQRGEICHFEAPGRMLKRKSLRTFQEDGQRYKVEGLEIAKEGDLLITSKRILLVHEGTSSIRHEKVLDVELDMDQNLLSIVKDGAQRPVLLTTPDARRAAAVLAAAADL